MQIKALAKASGVADKTIRYYESIELLPRATRRLNGYRDYQSSDLERLIFIRRCRELEIPLAQIKQLMRVQLDRQAPCQEVDRIIAQQLKNIRSKIRALKDLETTLEQLAHTCAGSRVEDCGILDKLSTKSKLGARI